VEDAISTGQLRAMRLAAHRLRPPQPSGAVQLVRHMVALQGQDLPSVLRAIALRGQLSEAEVRAAFDAGELVRGWPMRGTLFVTTPRDLAALGSLTRERMHAASARRRRELGIDESSLQRARAVAEELLSQGPATRAELQAAWQRAGEQTEGQRGYHLIVHLSQDGLMHWGPFRGGEQALVLSEGRAVLDPEDRDRGALLASLLTRYLLARGPARLEDLAFWLKLPKTELRAAVAAVGEAVRVVAVAPDDAAGGQPLGAAEHLVAVAAPVPETVPEPGEIQLLPGFDEYYLGYADRSAIASPAVQAAVVPGGNGMFRPLVLSGGRVVGCWRRAGRGRAAQAPIEVELIEPLPAAVRRAVDAAAAAWPFA